MNDDFLHRLHQAPRPEFLAALKSRLDRQPRRRPGFTLGVLVGLLAAGAAFAVYLKAYRQPEAPTQAKAAPLAPAWLPTHPNPGLSVAPQAMDTAAPSSERQPATATTATETTPQTFTFVATQQSLVSEMLATFGPRNLRVKSPHYSIRDSLQHLCDGTGAYDFPDMVQLNRRMTVEEYRTCAGNGPSPIVEQKLGYQAVVLARSTLYGPLRLTARDVFLALARRVPDPSRPGELLDNPYTNWNQVDPALPPDRIKFFGPELGSAPNGLPAELLLSAGCNTYPWIAALRDTDPGGYTDICQTMRSDGTYRSDPSGSLTETLAIEPTTIGIFPGIPALGEKLVANPVDGVLLDRKSLSSGTYPLARPLYLYLDKKRLNSAADSLVLSLVSPPSSTAVGKRSSAFWAFVPLDDSEQAALRKDRNRYQDLHF